MGWIGLYYIYICSDCKIWHWWSQEPVIDEATFVYFAFQEMLIYPEISDKEEHDELNHMIEPLERFFAEAGKHICIKKLMIW